MMKIQILGPGCPKCAKLVENVQVAVQESGIDAEVEKVTDMAEIMSYGVMSTPGVVVNGRLVHAGGIPAPDAVRDWVRE